LGPQLEAFTQKYLFPCARVITQHFLTTVPTIQDILQRELGMKKFSRRWMPHSLSPVQNVARVEASKIILRVLQDAESNDFEELQWVMSPSSATVIHLQQCLRGRHLRLF
jgi:hypothetical protein